MPRKLVLAVTLALSLLSTACLSTTDGPTEYADPAEATYGSSLGIDLATFTASNADLYVKEGVVGTGAIAALTDSVALTYTAFRTSGAIFDASPASGPIDFRLSRTVPGFAAGVTGMRIGGSRRLVVGPRLGYGLQPLIDGNGRTVLPGNQILVFDVRLDAIR